MSKDVIANDFYNADHPLIVTQIIDNGNNGACARLNNNEIVYYPIPSFGGRDECVYQACADGVMESEGGDCYEATLRIMVGDCPSDSPTVKPTELMNIVTPQPTLKPSARLVTDAPTDQPSPRPTAAPTWYVKVCSCLSCNSFCKLRTVAHMMCHFSNQSDYATIDSNNNKVTTSVNTPIEIQVLDNDVALEGLPLDITDLPFPGNDGTCTITNDGITITYTPNTDFFGMDNCIYTACDDKKHCDSATVVIVVNPTSESPIAQDDAVTTEINVPVDIFPLENDYSVPSHPLALDSIIRNAENGDCVMVNKQVVMYIPNPDFHGSDTCEYMACDNRGLCDSAVITITLDGTPCDDEESTDLIDWGTPAPTPIPEPVLEVRAFLLCFLS